MLTFRISGVVTEAESRLPLPGLLVKAYDEDLIFDDLLGSAITGPSGRFEIVSEADDFREFFQRRPDIYIRVLSRDGEEELFSTEGSVRVNAGRMEEFDIRVPADRLGGEAPPRGIALLDDLGQPREDFDVGESLVLEAAGLRPMEPHVVTVYDDGGEVLFSVRVLSGVTGGLSSTIWPQIGLTDIRTGEGLRLEAAREQWAGRSLQLTVETDGAVAFETRFAFPERFTRPLLYHADEEGRILNGFDEGTAEARVAAHNVPFSGMARVFLVERQRDWREGDAFEPSLLVSGRPAFADAEVSEDGSLQARVARARELRPGAYDLIVRHIRYGYEDDEDFHLRAEDLVTRRITGLVVREEFFASKVVLGGCVNTTPISGRKLIGTPYFRFSNVFEVGEDVWGALDPNALDPGLIGKKVAFYVVPHKTSAQWSADNSLAHLPVLGGNPAVQTLVTQSYCINANDVLLWPSATDEGLYDIVADFGNNAADPNAFVEDDAFDSPLDIIDGYFLPGFRVVRDPGTDTQWSHSGSFTYNDGSMTVDDESGFGSATVISNAETLAKQAVVYFPADGPGATTAGQISTTESNYPLVLIAHGNSGATNSFTGYDYLLEHLAKNGFIAASVHMDPGTHITGRAQTIIAHIEALKTKFGGTLANNIGIMGHSRGGEAVVRAVKLITDGVLPHDVNAAISLAPTDHYHKDSLSGAYSIPYLVVYGAMDGDVAGVQNTGFTLHDRASGSKKSMIFVYGSTHGRYNTVWGDTDITAGWSKLGSSDIPKLINADAHEKIAKAYMTAFYRWHLKGEGQWESLFQNEWVPSSVQTADSGKVRLFIQNAHTDAKVVDDFEGVHTATSWQTSTIGAAVTDGNTLPVDPSENVLLSLDTHSPHETSGLLLRWDGASDFLRFVVPAAHKDVTAYEAISFRITQRVGSTSNPSGGQDLYVTLADTGGKSRSVKVSKFGEVPEPQARHSSHLTKSAMNSVRIPLHVYTIKVVNTDEIDLANVESVTFDFKSKPTGEVEIDSVRFTD